MVPHHELPDSQNTRNYNLQVKETNGYKSSIDNYNRINVEGHCNCVLYGQKGQAETMEERLGK